MEGAVVRDCRTGGTGGVGIRSGSVFVSGRSKKTLGALAQAVSAAMRRVDQMRPAFANNEVFPTVAAGV